MIVLLVEDDNDVRQLLERALGDEFEVRSCATGGDGLITLRAYRVDVLLVDMDMQGNWGERLMRTARTLLRRVCVVAMSADPARLEASRALADGVIAKPFPLACVTAAVRRACGAVSPEPANSTL